MDKFVTLCGEFYFALKYIFSPSENTTIRQF